MFPEVRVGLGYDVHRLIGEEGAILPLGGAHLPVDMRFEAHSDGDVLLHSLIDAILGAIGYEGDIGTLFPMTEEFQGADSRELMRKVLEVLEERGYRLAQVDCTLVAERPRLGLYRKEIRTSLERVLGLRAEQIGLKFRSNEGLGYIGEGKAIAALSVVLLERASG